MAIGTLRQIQGGSRSACRTPAKESPHTTSATSSAAFYRADTSRGRHSGGSGIGLTITRALVEAHAGHIRAHSDGPGQGASFTVTIPKPG